MINKETGYIHLSDSLRLTPETEFASLMKMDLGEEWDVRDNNNDWKWINLKNLEVEDHHFILSIGFYNNRMKELRLLVQKEPFKFDTNWDSWDEQNEKDQLLFYRNWLTKEVGSERQFEWGTVWAEYDPKGGSSSIGIRYLKKTEPNKTQPAT